MEKLSKFKDKQVENLTKINGGARKRTGGGSECINGEAVYWEKDFYRNNGNFVIKDVTYGGGSLDCDC